MKIKITDIPSQGRELVFAPSLESLNARANAGHNPNAPSSASVPEYRFGGTPSATLALHLHGSNVSVSGTAHAQFTAACSRCAEPLEQNIEVDIEVILKPKSETPRRNEDEFEDLGFGYYDGREVDCGDIVEEFLLLQLPYTVTCEAESVSDCEQAQAALKYYEEDDTPAEDERFAILRGLKINGNGKSN